MTGLRITKIERDPLPGSYDLPHLQHFHWYLAGDVYPFAGQLRKVRLGKGGNAFCPPEEITARAAKVFDHRTDPDRLRTLDRDGVLTALTGLMSDVNVLHPFREVNGRTIRTFVVQLCAEAGWRLPWDGLDRDRNRAAARAAYDGDHGPLHTLLDERLTDQR